MDELEQRILDAAERLVIRFGYDKTNLEDIAQEAGIARSTLYKRWKRKDELVMHLIWQASRYYVDRLAALTAVDPQGGTFGGFFKNALLALTENEFLQVLYQREKHVLGALLSRLDIGELYLQRMTTSKIFLQLMQEAGTVRRDLDQEALAFVTNTMNIGFLKLNEILPAEHVPSVERVVIVVVDMLTAYVTPPEGGDLAAGKAAVQEYLALMQQQIARIDRTKE